MKRVLLILTSIAIVVSCQKKIENQSITPKKTVLKAEFEQIVQPNSQSQTKSVIELVESAAKFRWSAGDEIAVKTDAGFNKFTLQANPEDENKIEFVTDEECTPQEGAIYPFVAKSTDLTSVNLPTSYGALDTPYTEDTNMPMIASLEGDKLRFKHLGGVAMFPIENLPADAAQFVFTANGKKITGEFTLETVSEYQVINTSSDGANNAVTINFESLAAKEEGITNFYIPLPVGNYSGFTIQVKDSSNKDLVNYTSSKVFTVSRANVKVFNGFDCDKHLVPSIETIELQDANSFIIPLSSEVLYKVPTERVNTFWNDKSNGGNLPANALDSATPFTWIPEVIWIENTTGDITAADKANVIFCDENGNTQSEFTGNVPFYVKVNSATAKNILIGIKKKGTNEYLWSWHLWLTDYNPGLTPATTTGGEIHQYSGTAFQVGGIYEGKYVMDRNLGAIITSYDGHSKVNQSTNKGIVGLYYQFGRKDPFKTQGTVSYTSGTKSYAYSVNNPNTFITHSSGGDWHNSPVTAHPWNGSSDKKSIYDPCPAGWRVPANKTIWAGFSTSNFVWDGTYHGRLYNTKAWYPAAGYRTSSSSSLNFVGTYGYYWSSSPYSATYGYYLRFLSSSVSPSSHDSRAVGHPVRCVQE